MGLNIYFEALLDKPEYTLIAVKYISQEFLVLVINNYLYKVFKGMYGLPQAAVNNLPKKSWTPRLCEVQTWTLIYSRDMP